MPTAEEKMAADEESALAFFKNAQRSTQSTPKAGSNAGRAPVAGRTPGGRTANSGGRGPNSSSKKAKPSQPTDPWEGVKTPETTWSDEAVELLDAWLSAELDGQISLSDLDSFDLREGDRLLIAVLLARGRKVYPKMKHKNEQFVNMVRFYSREKLLQLINNKEELYNHMLELQAAFASALDPMKQPLKYKELYEGEVWTNWMKANDTNVTTEKNTALLGIAMAFLTRNFECTSNLMSAYKKIEELKYGKLIALMNQPCLLMRMMYELGKEDGCRFLPLELPKGKDYRLAQDKKKPLKDNKSTKKEEDTASKNSYSAIAPEEEEESDEGDSESAIAEAAAAAERAEEKARNLALQKQVEAQEAQTKLMAQKEEAEKAAAESINEKPAKQGASNKTEDTAGAELLRDIASFNKCLQLPNEIIQLNPATIRSFTTDDLLKGHIEAKLRSYLISVYSEDAEPFLEKIMEMNGAGVVDLIKSPGEMDTLAKAYGFKHALRLDPETPLKSRGTHPLKGNVYRTYKLRASKEGCKGEDPASTALPLIQKLFKTVEQMGRHAIKLVPSNPAMDRPHLDDIETIEAKRSTMKGVYIANITRSNWHDKLEWDMTIESSLDLLFLLTPNNAKGSAECEAFQDFMKKGKYRMHIEDIVISCKVPVVIVNKSHFGDDSIDHKFELIQSLRENDSIIIDPKSIELRRMTVTLPSKPDEESMFVKVLANPLIADELKLKLMRIEPTAEALLYPLTYNWSFSDAKESADSPKPLHEAITSQREFLRDTRTATVTGIGERDLISTIPKLDCNGRTNEHGYTIRQLLLGSAELGEMDGKAYDSPFDTFYKRGEGQYCFLGGKGTLPQMENYLCNHFSRHLQMWFDLSEAPDLTITVGGFKKEQQRGKGHRRPQAKAPEKIEHHITAQETTVAQEAQQAPPQLTMPPMQLMGTQPPAGTSLFDHYGVTYNHYPYGLDFVPKPVQADGLITPDGLNRIISSLFMQQTQTIGTALERALRMLDPAGRFATLLQERDKLLFDQIWETHPEYIYDAVEFSMTEVMTKLMASSDAASTGTTSPHSEPTKTPQPQQNPKTANNEEAETVEEVPHTDGEAKLKSPETDMEKSHYHTPKSSEPVSVEIESQAKEMDAELKATQLSFERYAGDVLSPILDKTTETTFSPNTVKLKLDLQNTPDKSNWDDSHVQEEKEQTTLEDADDKDEAKVAAASLSPAAEAPQDQQHDTQEEQSKEPSKEEPNSKKSEDAATNITGPSTPEKPIAKQVPSSAESIGRDSLRPLPGRTKPTPLKQSKISLLYPLGKSKKNEKDKI